MSSPFGPPPGLDIYENRQTIIWAALLIPYGFALISVLLRLLSRKLSRSGSWFDDWLMVGAMAIATGLVAGTIVALREGLGQHIWVFPTEDIGDHASDILLGLFELDNMYYACYGAVKLGILAFYWRTFKNDVIRRIVFLMNMAVVLWAGVSITMTVLECDPVSGFWIDPLEANCPIPQIPVHVALSAVSAVTNFVILILPVPYFLVPHHNTVQTITLVVLFSMGLCVCALSIVRTLAVANTNITDVDILFNLSNAWAWSVAEVQIAIFVTNLPVLGPVVAKLIPSAKGQFFTSGSTSSESLDARRPVMRERQKNRRRASSGAVFNAEEPTAPQEPRSHSVDLGYYEADEKYRSMSALPGSWYEGLERTQRVRSLEDAILEWERSETAPMAAWEHSHPTDWEKALVRNSVPVRPLAPQPRRLMRFPDEYTSTLANPTAFALAAAAKETGGTDTPPNVEWLRAYEAAADQDDEEQLRSGEPTELAFTHPLRSNPPPKRPAVAISQPPRPVSASPSPTSSEGGVPLNQTQPPPRSGHRRVLSFSPEYLRDSTHIPDVGTARQMTVTKVRVPAAPTPARTPSPPPIPPPRRHRPADGIHVRTDVNVDFARWSQLRD